jgi:SP family myo-inositol transporter-like MFS transporter 13
MYFSATIFAMVGFRNPTATSLLVATTNFLMTLVAFQFIDRIGRRRMLLISIPFMSLGLAIAAFAFPHLTLPPRIISGTTPSSSPPPGTTTAASTPWPAILTTSMLLFVAAYALGLGNVPWHQSELFPLSVRALGSAVATATNWGSNTLVGATFLPMMDALTPRWTFAIYAAVCAVCWAGVSAIYPETAGLALEDVGKLLSRGWGVRPVEAEIGRPEDEERQESDEG